MVAVEAVGSIVVGCSCSVKGRDIFIVCSYCVHISGVCVVCGLSGVD